MITLTFVKVDSKKYCLDNKTNIHRVDQKNDIHLEFCQEYGQQQSMFVCL